MEREELSAEINAAQAASKELELKKKELEEAQKKKALLKNVPCGNELHE